MENKINVRRVALMVLDRIEAAKRYSNIALDAAIEQSGAAGADRGLLTTLVYGVIERKITLDYQIDKMSSLPPSKIEASVRNALRLGLYQLIWLDRIPDHAAINESVELVGKRSKGFVNALLRSFVRAEKRIRLPREDDVSEYLSVKYSVSKEICERFCHDIGRERTEAIFSAMNEAPFMTLRTNTLKISRDALLSLLTENGISAEKTSFSEVGIKLSGSTPYSMIPGEAEGLWFVQDEASQLCAAVLGAKKGEKIIDCCASPGGKSFSVAMDMENEGEVSSFELHENKLSLIRRGAERLGIDIIRAEAKDGRKYDEALFETADRILCDVPCSGLGVIAKKPDIRYKELNDIDRLPEIQLSIAENNLRYLKKGGIMVYSTCTILPSENETNIKILMEKHPELSLVPFEVGGIKSDGMLTLYPDEHGSDGFFIAKLKKN